MKKIFLLFIFFVATQVFAQTNGINYQAIILNPNGEQLPGVDNSTSPLVNKNICMVFKFVDEFSNVEYQETIQTKTDGFGMVNLVIGSGTQTAGYSASFSDIVWNSSKKSLIVGINTEGSCSSYVEISNQDFSYVPLAYSAINAENVTGVVAIENGGTNATTLLGARTNLQINNVDNTSDLNKPISIATQSALNLKEDISNKSTDVITDANSDTKYPSVKSVKMYVDGKLLTSSNALDAEINRATAAENGIASNLLMETSNRTSQDISLQSSIDTVQADVDANETASNTADATLQTNIDTVQADVDANETASNTADATLQSNIDTVQADVDANETASNTADATLQTNIDTVQADVDANETASNTADATLQSNIDTVQSDVDANETASNIADATLQTNIDAVQADVDTNETASNTADTTLQSNIDAVQTDVDANETASNTADATLQTNVDAVQADVDANETASNTADTTLQTNINAVQSDVDANETASNTADTTLQTNIDAVQADVDANKTASNTADATLQSNIDAVQADVDANETASNTADATLQTNINAVQSDVDANETASDTADATLQSNIDTVQADVDANEIATATALNLKANLDSPTFTGTPTAPTATVGTNTAQLATTAFVSEAIVTYGVEGPQGPAGNDGLDGATGPMGPQGPQGPAGLDGADGLDGATGPMGPQGPQGPTGLDGADGLDGATGPMGPQGPQGPAGNDGLDGATGATGATGPAGTYTAGTGIDITAGVISSTGSSSMPEYAYAYIGNSSTLGAQTLTSMFPAATYVNGVVMNGSSITLHANKMYEVTVAFYIYNATGGHTFKMKDATNSAYLGTEIYFGQGGSDISYNMSMTNFLIKPSTDVNLELEKTQGTDVNLIGKIVVKEIK